MTRAQRLPWYRAPASWLRGLYDWTLSWAATRYATHALFVLAFMEASFFPIPPDVLLIALALGAPRRAFSYAAVCTAGSTAGGVLGWYIGHTLWQGLGVYPECPSFDGGGLLFRYVPGFTCGGFGVVQARYAEDAWLYLFISAFTPIPYKIFTVASGVFSVGLDVLVPASVLGRGARFFLVGLLIYRFGPPVRRFIETRFEALVIVFGALLVAGFVAVKYLF